MELIDAIRSGDVFMIIAQLIGFLALAISFTSAVIGLLRYRKKS